MFSSAQARIRARRSEQRGVLARGAQALRGAFLSRARVASAQRRGPESHLCEAKLKRAAGPPRQRASSKPQRSHAVDCARRARRL